MRKSVSNCLKIVVSLMVLVGGLLLIKTVENPQGIMKTLPYIMVGVGCGFFGQAVGDLLSKKAMKSSPEVAKQIEIETKDERNIAIANQSKAKAFDVMTFVFGALMLSFALMQIDMVAILLLVGSYLFVQGCGIYYRFKLEKTM